MCIKQKRKKGYKRARLFLVQCDNTDADIKQYKWLYICQKSSESISLLKKLISTLAFLVLAASLDY